MGKIEFESLCQKAMPYYFDIVSDNISEIPDEIQRHIKTCEHCKQEIDWLSQTDSETSCPDNQDKVLAAQTTHLELHFALTEQPVSCSTIKSYLPAMAVEGLAITTATPVTAHLKHCSRCTEDLAALKQMNLTAAQYSEICRLFSAGEGTLSQSFSESQQRIIREIQTRADSGVVTCFKVNKNSSNNQQTAWNVEVVSTAPEQNQRDKKSARIVTATGPKTNRHFQLQSKQLFRPVAAAAAILIGIFLLFRGSTVQATDISQIYEALKDVKNIVMTHYAAESSIPLEEIRIARDMGIKLSQTGSTITSWDINRKVRQTRSDTAPLQTTALSDAETDAVSKTMNIPFGLLPFKNTRELPKGAVWKKAELSEPDAAGQTMEVYDLFWTEQGKAYQWQCRIDAVTKRPQQIMFWEKSQNDADYELITHFEISYPTPEQMKETLRPFGL